MKRGGATSPTWTTGAEQRTVRELDYTWARRADQEPWGSDVHTREALRPAHHPFKHIKTSATHVSWSGKKKLHAASGRHMNLSETCFDVVLKHVAIETS